MVLGGQWQLQAPTDPAQSVPFTLISTSQHAINQKKITHFRTESSGNKTCSAVLNSCQERDVEPKKLQRPIISDNC